MVFYTKTITAYVSYLIPMVKNQNEHLTQIQNAILTPINNRQNTKDSKFAIIKIFINPYFENTFDLFNKTL